MKQTFLNHCKTCFKVNIHISVPWPLLNPNWLSEEYKYGSILMNKTRSNTFDMTVAIVTGLQFDLSSLLLVLLLIIGTITDLIISLGMYPCTKIALNNTDNKSYRQSPAYFRCSPDMPSTPGAGCNALT